MWNSTFKSKPYVWKKKPYQWKPGKPLKSGIYKLKRTPLKRVGKIGESNIEANKIISKMWIDADIQECEIKLEGICIGILLHNVHRHKRDFYKGDVKKLSNPKQVLRGCSACHDAIEHDPKLTKKIFLKLRGEE